MKKALLFLAAAFMLLVLGACGGQSQTDINTSSPESTVSQSEAPSTVSQPAQENGDAKQSNVLIAYFSLWDNAPWDRDGVDISTSASVVVDGGNAVGTTRYVAQKIQDIVGGDIHAIMAAEPYSADFDAVVSQNHSEDSRAISSTVENMEQHDVVFIGYPVWATSLPQAVRTFLSGYDLSGKTVIPFCTHDGYGAGSSFSAVAELVAGAETLEGLAIHAPDVPGCAGTVTEWLDGLGLTPSENTKASQGETPIRITIGELELEGVLYGSDMARQFIASSLKPLP